MDALLLDTHIAVWFDGGDRRLGSATRAAIDGCWQGGGTIYLSAISVWEMALLVDAGRLDLGISVESWVQRFASASGVEIAPFDHHAALRSTRLHDLEHRDPADRFLIATAMELGCPLVTYDDRILRFARRHGPKYRFATAG